MTKRAYRVNCNWKVFVDNYLDGGTTSRWHTEALASGIDIEDNVDDARRGEHRDADCFSLDGKEEGNGRNDEPPYDRRRSTSATYAYVYPNFMVNRYGPWMDTNLVTDFSATTCVVTFEYFLEPAFLKTTLRSCATHRHEPRRADGGHRAVREGAAGHALARVRAGKVRGAGKGMYHFHRKGVGGT